MATKGRPKLPAHQKKEKLNLTVSKDAKEKLELMRIKMDISISQFVELAIDKEYRKMSKKGEITDIPGQMSMDDIEK